MLDIHFTSKALITNSLDASNKFAVCIESIVKVM